MIPPPKPFQSFSSKPFILEGQISKQRGTNKPVAGKLSRCQAEVRQGLMKALKSTRASQ